MIFFFNIFLDTSNEDTPPSLHHFPENISDELIRIAEWLITHNRDEYMNVYAKVRETILENSMKQLKDQQKNASGGSIQNVQGILGSPLVVCRNQKYIVLTNIV